MRSLFVVVPFVLATGCIAEQAPPADVRVTFDTTTEPSADVAPDIETLVRVFDASGTNLDGAFVKGHAGVVGFAIDARPDAVKVCAQLYIWGEQDSPPPWCERPCLEQTPLRPEQCQEVVVDRDVHVRFELPY